MFDKIFSAENSAAAAGLLDSGLGYALDLLTAIAIILFGLFVAKWAQRSAMRALDRVQGLDRTVELVIGRMVKYVILIIVLIAVLAQFGVQTASIIAVLGAAGLAIGLALQGTLANIAAGFMLLLLRPIAVGDFIDTGGVGGTVDEIGLFMTELRTADGIFVSVPNSQLWTSAITNYSRLPTRRIDFEVGIAYEDDVEKGLKVLGRIVKAEKRFKAEPEPMIFVSGLGDSSVNLKIRAWTERTDYWLTLFDLNKETKVQLDKAGISIPYPQQDVHYKKED